MGKPAPNSTVVAAFLESASRYESRPAFAGEEADVTWGEARRRLGEMVGSLHDREIRKGDRVVLLAGNHADFALAYFAVHAVGAIAVILDEQARSQSLLTAAAETEPALAVSRAPTTDFSFQAATFDELTGTATDQIIEPCCEFADPADIVFTSGSTGDPKGVLLTHRNIHASASHINEVVRHGPEDRELVPIPFSHSFGMGRLRCMALTGNCLLLEPGLRDVASVLFRLLDHKATGLALVPSGFELMRRVTRDRLGDAAAHLKYIEIGSAPISAETSAWLQRLLPDTRIYHHYGMTEASRAVFFDFNRDKRKPGSIGLPSPRATVMIEDESGNALPSGEVGELVVSGDMVMNHYWGKQPQSGNARFRSNDLAYADEDGYLYLVGRKDNLINVGGHKVAPLEIETLLNTYADVSESACLSAPDPDGILGQVIVAFVVIDGNGSVDGLKAWLRERLETYKVPSHIFPLDALPKTRNDKIDYQVLRDRRT